MITITAEMELRNHAVMACDGVKIWPPKWLQTYGSGIGSESGEVGVLDGVYISQVVTNNVCLIMRIAEELYMGTLMFEKPEIARDVSDLLRACTGKRISDIGALDLPENFGS